MRSRILLRSSVVALALMASFPAFGYRAYSIGGAVSGLTSGSTVTLSDNGTDNLTVSSNGAFKFSTKLAKGTSYSVTVTSQPSGQTCGVTNGTGAVNKSNITNIAVSCAASTAQTNSGKSQVMILLSNSESMDGNVNGAIMTGSGAGNTSSSQSKFAGLGQNYNGTGNPPASPDTYTVPSGFTEACSYLTGGCNVATAGSMSIPAGSAAYTLTDSSSVAYDNSPSRMNIAKEAIQSIIQTYIKSIDVGLMDYSVNNPNVARTWRYLMSGDSGFGLTNTAGSNTIDNPCYNQSKNGDCSNISQAIGYAASYLSGYRYLTIAATSDDASINDVLYDSSRTSAFLAYGSVSPSNPYSHFTLAEYNTGNVSVTYSNTTYGQKFTGSPTNAGYMPFSPQVLFAERGFGWYDSSENPSIGNIVVSLTSSGVTPTAGSISAAIGAFTTPLAPETSSTNTSEIKATAAQAPTAGMLAGALSYFQGLPALTALPGSCTTPERSIVLITDGLPTEDLKGNKWPPLGSDAAAGYGETVSFNADGSLDLTNDGALNDVITEINALVAANVKVYVIGLGAGVNGSNAVAGQTLTAMAIAGGTKKFYTASDSTSLLDALNQIFSTSLTGPVISSSVTTPASMVAGSYAYDEVSDNTDGSKQGHLYAYAITNTGTVAASPAWDAASPTIQANRVGLLWSDTINVTTGKDLITGWGSLPSSAFAATGTPSASTISSYTVDPNYNSGTYLNGRTSGSIVGTMTSAAAKPVYVRKPANALLLSATGYATYAQSEQSRAPFVLWSSNDGFLYSSNASSGALNWAYMPSPLLSSLQNYTTFESSQPMDGGFEAVDGIGADSQWHSFVIGTAQSGAIHYSVQLDAAGMPDASVPVVMDNQSGATSPDSAAPVVVWDTNGVAYAIYVTVNGNNGYINVISSQGVKPTQAQLPFVPSSQIGVNQSTGDLFIGGMDGNVYTLNTQSGYTASDIAGTYSNTTSLVGAMVNTGDPAQYVGFSQTSNGLFVWATGQKQIDVFTYGSSGWTTNWSTQDGGPSSNMVNGTSTSYSTDPGVTGTGPQFLPALATITDGSVVSNGSLIVPVTTGGSGANACTSSEAYYYFFRLTNGTFPAGQFSAPDGTSLASNINIGFGTAFSPLVSYNSTLGGFSIYGSAQQNLNSQSLFSLVANAHSNVTAGIVGWRPLMMTHP